MGIHFPDMFSVKRGSLSSGNGSESSCPFPWKQCGERKAQERGRNMFVWVESNRWHHLTLGGHYFKKHVMNRHSGESLKYADVVVYLPLHGHPAVLLQCYKLKVDVCFLTTFSSTHLSAILANVGLSSHHRSDVVVQTPVKCDAKWQSTKDENNKSK